jgi:hypothetical protein
MVRRLFVSSLSSVAALAASALYSTAAAEAQSVPGNTRMPSLPEPEPIGVDDATLDRARSILNAVSQGTFDRSELLPQLNAFVVPETFAEGATVLSALGAPKSMFAFEKCITADQTSTYFRVYYPTEVLTWVVSVNPKNQITGLCLRRGPENRLFCVLWRNIEY